MQTTRDKSGFTLLEVMIVIAIFGLLASVAIPGFIEQQKKTQKIHCLKNLENIQTAKSAFAYDNWPTNRKTDAHIILPADIYGLGKYIDHELTCPAGGKYTLGPIGKKPACSIPGHAIAEPITVPRG